MWWWWEVKWGALNCMTRLNNEFTVLQLELLARPFIKISK